MDQTAQACYCIHGPLHRHWTKHRNTKYCVGLVTPVQIWSFWLANPASGFWTKMAANVGSGKWLNPTIKSTYGQQQTENIT